MLDIKYVRENPQLVKASEKKRNRNPEVVERVLEFDEQWKKELKEVEGLKHRRNVVSEEINQAKKAQNMTVADKKIREMREVADNIKRSEEKVNHFLQERNNQLRLIGNVLHKSVPQGKDESENKELRKVGKIPRFTFPIKDHIELGSELDLIDLDTAAAVAGARFFFLKNEAVLLDFALQKYALDKLLKQGVSIHL